MQQQQAAVMRSYSVIEAAQVLGVSTGTVYGLCSRRRIRHERHGLGRGTIRIPEDAIEEYRRSVTVAAEGGEPLSPQRSLHDVKHSGRVPA
jgi:excisionase family DNA binding protein